MKKLMFTYLMFVVLSSCSKENSVADVEPIITILERKIDASTPQTLMATLSELQQDMNEAEWKQFDEGLRMVQNNAVASMVSKNLSQDVERKVIETEMLASVDGMTVEEIIQKSERIRIQADLELQKLFSPSKDASNR